MRVIEEARPGWRMLLPHIDALASHAPADTDTEDTAYLLNQAGVFLNGRGQPGRAAGYLQRAAAGYVRVLGPTCSLRPARRLKGADFARSH